MAKVVAMVVVTSLDVATATAFGIEVTAIVTGHGNTATAVEAMMHVHAPAGVMDICDLTVRTSAYGTTIFGDMLGLSSWDRVADR